MTTKPNHVLLVEDNPQDEALTLRTLRQINMVSSIDVVRDGMRTGQRISR